MDLICLIGTPPGPITATVAHAGRIRAVQMTLGRHHAGGWRVELPDGEHGPRCHSVAAAVLMHASETLPLEEEAA